MSFKTSFQCSSVCLIPRFASSPKRSILALESLALNSASNCVCLVKSFLSCNKESLSSCKLYSSLLFSSSFLFLRSTRNLANANIPVIRAPKPAEIVTCTISMKLRS